MGTPIEALRESLVQEAIREQKLTAEKQSLATEKYQAVSALRKEADLILGEHAPKGMITGISVINAMVMTPIGWFIERQLFNPWDLIRERKFHLSTKEDDTEISITISSLGEFKRFFRELTIEIGNISLSLGAYGGTISFYDPTEKRRTIDREASVLELSLFQEVLKRAREQLSVTQRTV